MGNQLTVPSGSSWYLDDFNSNHLKNPVSIFDGTFSLSFRAEENKEYVAVKAIQLSDKYDRSIAQTFYNIYEDKSSIISQTKSGNYISTPILTKNGAYLKRPFIDMPLVERIAIDPPLNYFEKNWIAFQLLYAIRNLHKINIFHGDIKPENILVAPNLDVYITDHAPFKPQYISQTQPHYFIHFFSYGRPCAYIAPERISRDLSTSPELQKDQTNRAMLAIKAITASLRPKPTKANQRLTDSKSNQMIVDNDLSKAQNNNELNQANIVRSKSEEHDINQTNIEPFIDEFKPTSTDEESVQAMEALHAMQAADLFSIGCVVAFIYTGESLFDFSSLVQYGHCNDNSPLKALDKITDSSIRELILKLIDRDQKKRLQAINNFENSFPNWMNDFYRFYFDNIIDVPISKIPSVLSNKTNRIFTADVHDEAIIYLNIISEFFSKEMKISHLNFFIHHFEMVSFYVTSPSLKIVRLIPPLLFLLSRESPAISAVALDSILNIVRSIDNIDDEEDIVKCFSDVFFIPQLIKVMDPKNNRQSNEKLVIISRIPTILVEFQRLWPSILEKLPMRTEFIIPMLQTNTRDGMVDESKLMIIRYFLSSARTVAYTKSYPVFKALYMIIFQMLNCAAYVPLIVEFVMAFLKELNHGDKIRFYNELFPPFQGALLSYVLNFTNNGTADDILIIFDAFATMIENGEIKITNISSIANAVYKHLTSFNASSRVTAHVLLKKLPKIYQEFDVLSIIPQQPQTQQPEQQQPISPVQMHRNQSQTLQRVQTSYKPTVLKPPQTLPGKSQRSSKGSISVSNQRKKNRKGNSNSNIPLIEENENESNDNSNLNDATNQAYANLAASTQAPNLIHSSSINAIESMGNSVSTSNIPSMTPASNSTSNVGTLNLVPEIEVTHGQRRTSRSSSFQSQIKSNLFSSTKIATSKIQKILIVHNEDGLKFIVLHSNSTVVCYSLNININNKFNYPLFENKTIEHSWIYNFPEPVVNIDSIREKGKEISSGLIVSLPDSVIKRSNGQTIPIYQPKIPIKVCKMIDGTTMATAIGSTVACCDITKNFSIKGTYKVEPGAKINSIYSWESMDENFFAFSTLNGRLYAIDQRTNVPIFVTAEYPGMSQVVLLPHLAYAFVRGCRNLNLYRFSPSYLKEEAQLKNAKGGYSPKPIYEVKGNVNSIMSISNSILMLNQYGTFMLDNFGACFSLSDKNKSKYLKPSNNSINNNIKQTHESTIQASSPYTNSATTDSIGVSHATIRTRSMTTYDIGPFSGHNYSLSKSDYNMAPFNPLLKTPVVNLPVINRNTLHGHTFPITACTNYKSGAVCISGDSSGYINVWSAIHPKSEIV